MIHNLVMRTILLTILLASPILLFSQTEEETVKKIRSWYKETEASLADCRVIHMNDWEAQGDYDGFTPEFTAYFDTVKREFIKILQYGGGDWYEEWTSYYLRNNELFFIFSKGYTPGEMYTAQELNVTEEELWEMGQEAKTLSAFETRIYYNGTDVIRYLTKDKEVSAEGEYSLKDVKNEKQEIPSAEGTDRLEYLRLIMAELKTRI